MVRIREEKITKEKFYAEKKIYWDIHVDNIFISRLTETKN